MVTEMLTAYDEMKIKRWAITMLVTGPAGLTFGALPKVPNKVVKDLMDVQSDSKTYSNERLKNNIRT